MLTFTTHNMLFKQSITAQPFTQWLVEDKENKRFFRFSLIVMVASFGWLKFVYPYPNFLQPDSMSYMDAALKNDFINYWPIGYSKFLRLVSVFSRSHLILVVLQYLLLMSSVLYFLFTIRYLLPSDSWLFRSLFAISIINPLIPHIANIVSSDALFASLSLAWFTQLLWISYRPGRRLLFFHAAILLLAFTVRFSAIWYPFVSISTILLASIPKRNKWLGVASLVTGLLVFIGCTGYEYYKRTNTIQYSAFGRWQMAANALYAYAYAEPIDPGNVPVRFHDLHAEVNRHMDSLRQLDDRPDEEIGVYYLWITQSPLIQYGIHLWQKKHRTPQFIKWSSMAPLYGDYGRWLITQHPGLFIEHFALPNLERYYQPPVTSLELYNLGDKRVDSVTVTWFNLKDNQLPYRLHDPKIHIMVLFPPAISVINTIYLVSALVFLGFVGLKQCNATNKRIFSIMLLVWLCNLIFSVISAPTELRYQIFPVIITFPFCMLIISWLIQASKSIPAPSLE
jgi:hypothetical protein